MRLRHCLCVAALALCLPTLQAQSASQPPYNSWSGYHSPFSPDPVVTNMLIDDWLGYGYLRNQPGNYAYGGYNNSMYAPAWPGLFSPNCPLWFPFRPVFCLLAPLHPWPGYGYPGWQGGGGVPQSPYWRHPNPAFGNAPSYPSYPCPPLNCPPNPCPPMPCPPQPVCPPIAVRVPVTTCRPVTVDAGYYQQVWVSRPQTMMVPETRWQTRYVQPGQGWQSPYSSFDAGCTGADCQPIPAVPGLSQPIPENSTFQQQTGPGVNQNSTQFFPTSPATGTVWQHHTSRSPVMSGDIYGDHEASSLTRTGQIPVTPNSFGGSPPVVNANLVRRYPVAVQPQRRYTSSVR